MSAVYMKFYAELEAQAQKQGARVDWDAAVQIGRGFTLGPFTVLRQGQTVSRYTRAHHHLYLCLDCKSKRAS